MSKDSNAKIFSVIGGCRRSGRWLVPAKTEMMTFFGRVVIDLRQAQTSAEELEFTCTSAFANITFIVPEGAEVRPSGMAVLGSSKCIVPVTSTPCHLPPISVDATTILGRLRVRTTDRDPDDNQGRRWFRRKRSATPAAGSVSSPSLEPSEPGGVEPRGFSSPSTTAVSPATASPFTADAPATASAVFSPDAPATATPFTPDAPPSPDPASDAETPETPETQAFSPPVPPRDDAEVAAERSPLENVEVPESLEGTVAEAETPSTT